MKAARKTGIVLIVASILSLIINGYLLYISNSYFQKLTAAIPALFFIGLALIIRPGTAEGEEAMNSLRVVLDGANKTDRTVWIIFTAVGLIAGFALIFIL